MVKTAESMHKIMGLNPTVMHNISKYFENRIYADIQGYKLIHSMFNLHILCCSIWWHRILVLSLSLKYACFKAVCTEMLIDVIAYQDIAKVQGF